DDLGFPGMRILQYGFGGDAKNTHLPHNYTQNCVAYTGTHDNDTIVGWWSSREAGPNAEREFCERYLNTEGKEINWDFIRAVLASVADTAIVPLQDVLRLGNEARMNLPATHSGNWSWRFTRNAIKPETISRMRELTETYGRLNRDFS